MRLLRMFNIDGIGTRLRQVCTPGQRLHLLYLLYGTFQTLNCVQSNALLAAGLHALTRGRMQRLGMKKMLLIWPLPV